MFVALFFGFCILQVGESSNVTVENENSGLSQETKSLMDKIHGICMVFAWFFFVIIAIGSARYFKEFQTDVKPMGVRIWFWVHRTFNYIAVILMILGLIAIFIAHEWKWSGPRPGGGAKNSSANAYHAMFGILCCCLAFTQPLGALIRCAPDARLRPIFNLAHRLIGIIAWVMAAVTITIACKFFGLKHFTSPDGAVVLCATLIAITGAIFIISEFLATYSKIEHQKIPKYMEVERPRRIFPIQTLMFAIYILISFGLCLALCVMIAFK